MVLGIMQGRLSPPVDGRFQFFPRHTWEEELPLAHQAGLGAIEWIYDQYGAGANPLETDEGIARIHELAQQSGIAVRSICADWFMEELLVGGKPEDRLQARERLTWLIGRAEALGVTRIVLPFVDASALSSPGLVSQAVEAVEGALAQASAAQVELHLETSLDPAAFASLLSLLPDPLVKVNYDIGNSSSLGYSPHDEFRAYGERVGSVHIKDRVKGGSTVALGTGDADFDAVADELDRVEYSGPFVLQAARGEPGRERERAADDLAFALRYFRVAGS